MGAEPTFSEIAWKSISAVRQAIDTHPFLGQLRDGTLPRKKFVDYLAQDAHYLIGYARVLALCAAQSIEPDDISFWASNSRDAVVVERSLHQGHVADVDAVAPSPTCTAYVSFLLGTATAGSYPVLTAAVLPCFWIYQDVGCRLQLEVEPAGHPYADWIASYGDPDFGLATQRATGIVDRLAEQGSAELRGRMHAAFAAAARYEWMFWDSAWRGETWPDFGPAKGNATTTATTNDAIEADSHG